MHALRQQMEDLLEDFFPSGNQRRPNRPAPAGGGDHPIPVPVNIAETDTEVTVQAPLPGMSPDDIEINMRGQNLTIKAQVKNPSDRRELLRREWGSGPFQRSIEIPVTVDADQARAGYKNGVVTITLPKSDASRTRTISVDGDEESEAPTETFSPENQMDSPGAEAAAGEPEEFGLATETIEVTDDSEVETQAGLQPPVTFEAAPETLSTPVESTEESTAAASHEANDNPPIEEAGLPPAPPTD